MQRFHATLPQVLNIVDKSDRLAISFPPESKSPTSFYCGIEVAPGDMIVHRPDLIHKRCGDDLTRENVLKQAADLKNLELGLLLPGIAINTGPSDYFPIKQMQLSRFNGEKRRAYWIGDGRRLYVGYSFAEALGRMHDEMVA